MDHRLRDHEPGMLKTRDFSVKGRNDFSSIHLADMLNHAGPPSLLAADKSQDRKVHNFNFTTRMSCNSLGGSMEPFSLRLSS
jgi:hypothetical protein